MVYIQAGITSSETSLASLLIIKIRERAEYLKLKYSFFAYAWFCGEMAVNLIGIGKMELKPSFLEYCFLYPMN